MSGLIRYTAEDGHSRIQLRPHSETVWLIQLEITELFAAKKNMSRYLKSLFGDGEVAENSVVNQYLTTAVDGKRHQVLNDSVGLHREATLKESLTVQTVGRQWATIEDFSIDQTLGTGQALRCARFWNQVLLRQRLPSLVGN